MAIAAVQRKIKAAIATSISIGSGDGWSTPTAGNLLVASANADATVTMTTSGFTAGPNVVDGNGAYSWYKVAAGTESTITATPSGSSDIVLSVCEYSGASGTPFDVSNSSTIAGSAGTTTTSASVTTTAAGDLILGFALLHSLPTGSVPTGPSWTNSLVNQLSGDSAGASGGRCISFVGELLAAGAAGSYSSVCSWTNLINDRQHIILAFKAAAGGGSTEHVFPRRPARGLYMR